MNPPTPPGPANARYRLMLKIYFGLFALGLPLVWRYFRRRAVKDADYAAFPEQRRGEGVPFRADVWLHAVSLGEMRSAEPLVRLLLARGSKVITTHATPAGVRAAETTFAGAVSSGRVAVRYAPVDLPEFWVKFFAGTKPSVGLVMEMEFWPGMIEAAAQLSIPLCLVNSQIPSKSFGRAKLLARTFGHPVARTAAVFAKSERMADRFRALGAGNVVVSGETRFDIPAPPAHVEAGALLKQRLSGRPVVTIASVVAGEEDLYIAAIHALLKSEPVKPLFIWVPRAPELFDKTTERLRNAGFRVATRSESFSADLSDQEDLMETDVLVGNSFGEMFFYLAPADAVIVGGGFVEKGAHNVIEPLALGKPVITGPSVWTIEYPATEAEAAGVLTICSDPDDLADTIKTVMAQGEDKARAFHAANAGASERILARITPLLRSVA